MADLTQLKIVFATVGLLVGVLIGYFIWGRSPDRNVAEHDVPPATQCRHDSSVFRCVRFLGNYDGDTIRVSIPGVHPLIGEKISVRVLGIDTPEMKGRGRCEATRAKEARDVVTSFLQSAKAIEIRNVQRDKYFRVLGDIIADGKSLKDALLMKGVAVAYDGGTKEKPNWCRLQ